MTSMIGVELDPIPLIITKGRDFRWSFQHRDKDGKDIAFPAGRLYFELQTGGASSSSQSIELDRATGGSFSVSLGGSRSAALPFDARAAVVQAALEGLPSVGVGNVRVSADVTPVWLFTGSITGVTPVAGAVKGAVETVFSAIPDILGVDVAFTFNNPGYEISVTARRVFDESSFGTWTFNQAAVAGSAVQVALNKVFGSGAVTVNQVYFPKRLFHVSFQGSLANSAVGALSADVSGLSGQRQAAVPLVVTPGVSGVTLWEFTIAGTKASLKVESEAVDKVANRTHWQLVWLPAGEPAGGDPVARGVVRVQQ